MRQGEVKLLEGWRTWRAQLEALPIREDRSMPTHLEDIHNPISREDCLWQILPEVYPSVIPRGD